MFERTSHPGWSLRRFFIHFLGIDKLMSTQTEIVDAVNSLTATTDKLVVYVGGLQQVPVVVPAVDETTARGVITSVHAVTNALTALLNPPPPPPPPPPPVA